MSKNFYSNIYREKIDKIFKIWGMWYTLEWYKKACDSSLIEQVNKRQDELEEEFKELKNEIIQFINK